MSGWGLKFFDYDNVGNLDLFIANRHPDDLIDKINPGVTYSEPLLLFKNVGGRLKNVSSESASIFTRPLSARALATGDFDNDGAVDVLILRLWRDREVQLGRIKGKPRNSRKL